MEARAARSLGLTITQWDDLTDEERAWALVPDTIHDQSKCSKCGGDPNVCQNPNYQHAWEVQYDICYVTKTLLEASQRDKADPLAGRLIPRLTLHPERAKSARKPTRPRGGAYG